MRRDEYSKLNHTLSTTSSSETDEEDVVIPPLVHRATRRLYVSDSEYLESASSKDMFLYSEKVPLLQKDLFPSQKPWWADDDSVSTKAHKPSLNIIPIWFTLSLLHFCSMAVFDILSNPLWLSAYGLFLNPLIGPGELTLYRFGLLDPSQPWRCLTNLILCAHLPQLVMNSLAVKIVIPMEEDWPKEKIIGLIIASTAFQFIPALFGQLGSGGSVFPIAILSAHCIQSFSGKKDWKTPLLMILLMLGMGITSYMNICVQIFGLTAGISCGLYYHFKSPEDKKPYLSPILEKAYETSNSSTKKLWFLFSSLLVAIAFVAFPFFTTFENCTVQHLLLVKECMESCLYSSRMEEGGCEEVGYNCLSKSGRDVAVYASGQCGNDVEYFGVGRLAVEDAY